MESSRKEAFAMSNSCLPTCFRAGGNLLPSCVRCLSNSSLNREHFIRSYELYPLEAPCSNRKQTTNLLPNHTASAADQHPLYSPTHFEQIIAYLLQCYTQPTTLTQKRKNQNILQTLQHASNRDCPFKDKHRIRNRSLRYRANVVILPSKKQRRSDFRKRTCASS